ncbi:MAG: tyrosine-type recombinase/integrase [Nitrospirales bacterium]
MATYAAGLRVSEVCALQLADIESAPDQMCLKVRQGKGGRDRYTMLSPALLQTLRDYWRLCRPRSWLFPNPSGTGPIAIQTAQRMYWAARDRAGLGRAGGIHTLRHCFATNR